MDRYSYDRRGAQDNLRQIVDQWIETVKEAQGMVDKARDLMAAISTKKGDGLLPDDSNLKRLWTQLGRNLGSWEEPEDVLGTLEQIRRGLGR